MKGVGARGAGAGEVVARGAGVKGARDAWLVVRMLLLGVLLHSKKTPAAKRDCSVGVASARHVVV